MLGRLRSSVLLALCALSCGERDGQSGPEAAPECAAEVSATTSAFVPAGAEVHCTDAVTFDIGRDVRLTHVEYGALMDCPAGCFASHVCAIEDPELPAPALFYAAWTNLAEVVRGLEAECPTLQPSAGETWPDCVPSGLSHPLVDDSQFRSWAEDEAGTGPMRWCINRYALDGSFP